MRPKNHTRLFDTALTALAPLFWGTTYIVTTEFLPPAMPFTAATIRTLPAGMLLALLLRQWPKRAFWGRLLVLSALNIGIFQALLFVAAYRLPGGLAAVMGAVQPLLVMGFAWVVERSAPARMAVVASLVAVAGMALLLLVSGAAWDPIGIAAALAGTTSMAAGSFLARRWKPEVPVLAFTAWQLLLGGLMLAPLAWFAEPPLPHLGISALLAYAYLGVIGTLLTYALWFRGIARLSPVAVSSLGLLSPLTAVVLGWIVLGQAMRGGAMLGFLTVLGSVLAVQWSMRPAVPAQLSATVRV
jgi:probable blue pigment (indigoidine) exporter